MSEHKMSSFDDEVCAMRAVEDALDELDAVTCRRVVRWVDRKFRVDRRFVATGDHSFTVVGMEDEEHDLPGD